MAFMRTSNPTLNDQVFRSERAGFGDVMTVQGAVNKTGILLLCAIATAAWTWNLAMHSESPQSVAPLIVLGSIGGLVVALVTVFKKQWSAITAPLYALLEGLVLGAVSAIFEVRFPGIAIEAVALTFGTMLVLLLAYSTGMIRVSDKFRLGVVAATGGIAVFYFLTWILNFFHVQLFASVYGAGTIGIAFSVFVVIVAALNLVLDFDLIEHGAAYGAPKYMEWYSGFALMVTLIWMYFEMLRLLSKLRERR